MQTIQTLQQELTDTRRKLQDYADTIVSLHGELRSLRESICNTCKGKFVPANLVSSTDSSSSVNKIPQSPAKHTVSGGLLKAHDAPSSSRLPTSERHRSTIPHVSQTFPSTVPQPFPTLSPPNFIRSPPPFKVPTMHGNKKPASIPRSATPTSSKAITKAVLDVPRWSAKRFPTADVALSAMFVCAFEHNNMVESVRFSADGKYLAAAIKGNRSEGNATIMIYDVENRKKSCELVEYASKYSPKKRPDIDCLCFNPDGRYLVAGDAAGHVTVWDIANNRIRNVFRGHTAFVLSVDFSPNGRLVVSASVDRTVRIWNMRDGSARVFNDATDRFWSVRFSPNGQYVAASNDDRILRMWAVRTSRLVKRWTGHTHDIKGVAFTLDGRELVSAGLDGIVKCWDVSSIGIEVRSGREPVATKILKCSSPIYSIAVSPDARWIAPCLWGRSQVLWNGHSAIQQCELIGHKDVVSSFDFSPKGNYLALGSQDHLVSLWRLTGS